MTDTNYRFLPSLRQGMAAYIEAPIAADTQRIEMPVGFTVEKRRKGSGQREEELFEKTAELYAPGDIKAIEEIAIARRYPEPDVGDFEPNFFPAAEFADPDYPWSLTPDVAGPKGLMPWLTLIVLIAESRGDAIRPEFIKVSGSEDDPYSQIKVLFGADGSLPLPDLEHAWRWAHVQVVGDAGPDEEILADAEQAIDLLLEDETLSAADRTQLEQERQDLPNQLDRLHALALLRQEPERVLSRLLCPRRLQPGVKYEAFLVPTFKLGVLAGLGDPPNTAIGGLEMAWQGDETDEQLPYYGEESENGGTIRFLRLPILPRLVRWEFRTGLRGDFEHLVRLLEDRDLSQLGIGKRDMDCSRMQYGVEPVNRQDPESDDSNRHLLELEGALQSLRLNYTSWGQDATPPEVTDQHRQIAAVININEPDPTVQDEYPGADTIGGITARAEVSSTTAEIRWTTTIAARSLIDYGPTDAHGQQVSDPAFKTDHSLQIDGLLPGRPYHFSIVAEAQDGTIDRTDNATFRMPPLPKVVPPIHGRWHAARHRVDPEAQAPDPTDPNARTPWLNALNLDPRHRAAAGLGAEVVRRRQEALMTSAWDQLGAVESVNDVLRRAQVGRETTTALHQRLQHLDLQGLLQMTAGVQSRMRVEDTAADPPVTVTAKHLLGSLTKIPSAALDAAYRRIARPRGTPLRRNDDQPRRDILESLADGSTAAAPPTAGTPIGTYGICDVSKDIRGGLPPQIDFNAVPTLIDGELHADLSWTVADADGCAAAGSPLWSGDKPLSGQQTIGPLRAKEILVLFSQNAVGDARRSVTVLAPPTVELLTFTHQSEGGSAFSYLRWHSVRADNRAAQLGWSGDQDSEGVHKLFPAPPTNPTEYGLLCRGEGGVAEQKLDGAPMVYVFANPRAQPQDQITLDWHSAHTNSCSATGAWSIPPTPSGSEVVGAIDSTTNFPITCHGVRQDAQSLAAVVKAPSVKITPTTVGNSVDIHWSSENATSCTSFGVWGTGDRESEGTHHWSGELPRHSHYGLECSGPTGMSNQWIHVETPYPENVPLVDFSVCTFKSGIQYYALVEWNCINTISCSASFDGNFVNKPNNGIEIVGPIAPPINRTIRFNIVCTGANNDRTHTNIDPVFPPSVTLTPASNWMTAPQPIGDLVLEWETKGLTSTIEAQGNWSGDKSAVGTENVGPITGPSTFMLEVTGDGGSAITSFTANASPRLSLVASSYLSNNETYATLSWGAEHGTSCMASWSSPQDRPLRGQEQVGPIVDRTDLTLTCEGLGGTAVRTVTIEPLAAGQGGTGTEEIVGDAPYCEEEISRELINDQMNGDPFAEANVPEMPDPQDAATAVSSVIEDWLNKPEDDEPGPPDRDRPFLEGLRQTILEALHPDGAMVERTRNRITLDPAMERRFEPDAPGDPLEPVMFAPEFPQPMYEPLRDMGHALLVPGVEKIKQNTIGFLKPNRRFIESYMAGLNHEFAAELLWREYPTDQRGSYFRQHWDVSERIDGDEIPEGFKDIERMRRWRGNALGDNRPAGTLVDDPMVLVVRGNLLKRYPNTLIYAIDAIPADGVDGPLVPALPEYIRPLAGTTVGEIIGEARRIFPIFRATLPPDLTFLGFPITEEEARDKFIVLEERVGETRFGLDTTEGGDLNTWDDLSWSHFGLQDAFGSYLDDSSIAVEPTDPDGRVWDDSAGSITSAAIRAWITMQKPVRIAVHGSGMLPPAAPD